MGEATSPYEHSFDIKKKTVTYEPQKAIGGTKFLLYVQPPWSGPAWSTPEVITVSANNIAPGPEDDRFKVVDAKDKIPYGDRNFPPWNGQVYAKAVPDAQGNFTHYQPRTREFNCCVMYATVRRVLDVWEGFFGQHIPWHFENYMKKMELIPQIEWDNAQSGYGFLEFGFGSDASGNIDHTQPYCRNFDVLSHELGHSLIFSMVGFPENGQDTDDFGGFHESAGDLVALISSLHFKTMVDRLLDNTKGDLFSRNELSRLGELSVSREIRLAFNDETMMTVSDEPHDRSLPLTGAIFDIFVEAFQYTLVKNNLISQELAARSLNDNKPLDATEAAEIRNAFTQAYTGNENEFKNALIIARDYIGKALAYTWKNLKANNFTYGMIALGLLEADLVLTQGAFHSTIQSCFSWRKIKIDPRRSLLFHRNQVATRW